MFNECLYLDIDGDGFDDNSYNAGLNSVECPDNNNCPSDINSDGSVSTADLLEFLSEFGAICD